MKSKIILCLLTLFICGSTLGSSCDPPPPPGYGQFVIGVRYELPPAADRIVRQRYT